MDDIDSLKKEIGMAVTREDRFAKLKNDRDEVREMLEENALSFIAESAKGGFFPDMQGIINSVLNNVSIAMRDSKGMSAKYWALILQEKRPRPGNVNADRLFKKNSPSTKKGRAKKQ